MAVQNQRAPTFTQEELRKIENLRQKMRRIHILKMHLLRKVRTIEDELAQLGVPIGLASSNATIEEYLNCPELFAD